MYFINELYTRNPLLSMFGWFSLVGVIACSTMIFFSPTEVLGINAWIKPTKFFLSAVIFVWSMAWYLGYLSQKSTIQLYSWVVIAVLTFELVWITYQASKGELSHFNSTTQFNTIMWSLMGLAISVMTIFTLYIGILFFRLDSPELSEAYLWSIRAGIIIFVIFAFEGGLMGMQNGHTVGATDGGIGLMFLNWSVTHGDLRIAHFVGMHALQVLPFLGYYLFNTGRSILAISAVYLMVAVFILAQAIAGKPFITKKRMEIGLEQYQPSQSE